MGRAAAIVIIEITEGRQISETARTAAMTPTHTYGETFMNAQPSPDQITLVLDREWDVPADRDMHTAPDFESETSGLTEYDCQWDGTGTFAGGGNGYC
jgi:hypothetical protein